MKKKTMVCVGMDVLPSMAATSRAAIAALEVAWCNRKAAGDMVQPTLILYTMAYTDG